MLTQPTNQPTNQQTTQPLNRSNQPTKLPGNFLGRLSPSSPAVPACLRHELRGTKEIGILVAAGREGSAWEVPLEVSWLVATHIFFIFTPIWGRFPC